MRSKRLISLALVSAMAVTSIAGCSKSKVRKIEGASDDVASFVSVSEKIFDMKGVKATYTMNLDSNFDGMEAATVATSAKGSVTGETLIDASGNMSEKISVDLTVGNYKVNGEVAKFSYVDNMAYIDFSGVYDIANTLAGSAVVTAMLENLSMSEADVKKMLCVSIPTGDLKASDFGLANFKDIVLKLDDVAAKALTDAKVITKDKDTYTYNLNKDTAKAMLSSFATAFEANGSEIYDAVIAIVDKDDVKNKLVSMVGAIGKEVSKGMGSEEALDTAPVKEALDTAIKTLKDNKDDYLKLVVSAIKDPEALAGGIGDQVDIGDVDVSSDVKCVLTDEKDGYTIKMDVNTSASEDAVSAEVKANATVSVTSSSDKVAAPENATAISEVFATVVPLVSSLLMGSSIVEEY